MMRWGLQGTVPLPAGERLVPRGEVRPTGQTPSASSGVGAFPKGRKAGRLTSSRRMDYRKDDNKVAKEILQNCD